MGFLPTSYWSGRSQRSEKQPDYGHALGYSSPNYASILTTYEDLLDAETILMKATQPLDVTHREAVNQNMNKKVPPGWPVYIMLKDAMQAGGGENAPTVLPRAGLCMLQSQPARHGVSNGAKVA